jgi:hypothetical protein
MQECKFGHVGEKMIRDMFQIPIESPISLIHLFLLSFSTIKDHRSLLRFESCEPALILEQLWSKIESKCLSEQRDVVKSFALLALIVGRCPDFPLRYYLNLTVVVGLLHGSYRNYRELLLSGKQHLYEAEYLIEDIMKYASDGFRYPLSPSRLLPNP